MIPLEYTLYGVAVYFLITWICLWAIHLMALVYAKVKLHKNPPRLPKETPYPGVSILKPLTGVDPNLYANLETFFTMDYPVYEVLFCVEDEHDPAAMLARALIDKYPTVTARLITGGRRVGVNPKINNMQPGYEAARYELVLVSDAGIRMRADTLHDMVSHFRDDVAIVHQMPFACDAAGFASVYEKVFFGTVQARMYLAADLLGINCHVGMSSLVRRAALDDVGGLAAFGDYLAEDYMVARALVGAGWRLRVSSQPAQQNAGARSVAGLQSRLVRWTRLRIAMLPLTALLEPLSECVALGVGAAWAAGLLLGWEPLPCFLVHALAWFLSDWLLLRSVQNGPVPFSKADFALGWAWRELCAPVLFMWALVRPEVGWRTRRYRLAWGGRAYQLQTDTKC